MTLKIIPCSSRNIGKLTAASGLQYRWLGQFPEFFAEVIFHELFLWEMDVVENNVSNIIIQCGNDVKDKGANSEDMLHLALLDYMHVKIMLWDIGLRTIPTFLRPKL